MLAIINVLENRLYFFSLALNKRLTRVSVIPAKSNNNKGQNLVSRPAEKNTTVNPAEASMAVKMVRLRIKRFSNSFILSGFSLIVY